MLNGGRLARVVAFHPGRRSADLIALDDGWRWPRVPILCETASSDTGSYDIPEPDKLSTENGAGTESGRVLIAGVMFFSDHPVIVGFLPPLSSQMLFDEQGRYIHRLASDVYVTGDKNGNLELAHPSGTYLRIGETTAHENLTGKDVNGRWAIARNTGRSPHVHLELAAAGTKKISLDLAPDGKVTLDADSDVHVITRGKLLADATGDATVNVGGNLSADVEGAATVQVDGNVTATVGGTLGATVTGNATVTAPTVTINGDVQVNGNLAVTGTGAVAGALSSATSVADSVSTMDTMRTKYNAHKHRDGNNNTDATAPLSPNQM